MVPFPKCSPLLLYSVYRLVESGIVHHYHNAKLVPVGQCCRGESRSQLNFFDMVSVFYLYSF
ncbi:hypothetical protein MRX96_053938, partial [Rhipicephalus microplus]